MSYPCFSDLLDGFGKALSIKYKKYLSEDLKVLYTTPRSKAAVHWRHQALWLPPIGKAGEEFCPRILPKNATILPKNTTTLGKILEARIWIGNPPLTGRTPDSWATVTLVVIMDHFWWSCVNCSLISLLAQHICLKVGHACGQRWHIVLLG